MCDGRRSRPGVLERRTDHWHLNVRQVLLQLGASTRTPRSRWRTAVPVPHIEMKGNGTAHTPARTADAHGHRTEKRPPVLEPLCNHLFHRLSRPPVHQLSRSLSVGFTGVETPDLALGAVIDDARVRPAI